MLDDSESFRTGSSGWGSKGEEEAMHRGAWLEQKMGIFEAKKSGLIMRDSAIQKGQSNAHFVCPR